MKSCVLDTDVVIAALDRADVHHADATSTIRKLAGNETTLLLSLINYAESLVRPAQNAETLQIAVRAISAMGVKLVSPTTPIAREAARLGALNISLADGFALATARAHAAYVATFDQRVRRSLGAAGVELAPAAG